MRSRELILMPLLLIILFAPLSSAAVTFLNYNLLNTTDSQYASYIQMLNQSVGATVVVSNPAVLSNNLITCWNASWLANNWTVATAINGTWNFSSYTNCSASFSATQYFLFAKILKRNSTAEYNFVNSSLAGFACASGNPTAKNWSLDISSSSFTNLSSGERIGVRFCVKVTGSGAANKYGYMEWGGSAPSFVRFPTDSQDVYDFTVSPTLDNFSVYNNTFIDRNYTLTNTGNQLLNIDCSSNATWVTNFTSCPVSLEVGSSANITFRFNTSGQPAGNPQVLLNFTDPHVANNAVANITITAAAVSETYFFRYSLDGVTVPDGTTNYYLNTSAGPAGAAQTLVSSLIAGGKSYNFTIFERMAYNGTAIINGTGNLSVYLISTNGILGSIRAHFYDVSSSGPTWINSSAFTSVGTISKTAPSLYSQPFNLTATIAAGHSLGVVVEVMVAAADSITFYYDNSTLNSSISINETIASVSPTNLTIWSDTDPTGGNKTIYPGDQESFFANYTNTTGGAVQNATCEIIFNSGGTYTDPANMTFDNSSQLYTYVTSIYTEGSIPWQVTCSAPSFAAQTRNTTTLITTISNPILYYFHYSAVGVPVANGTNNYHLNETFPNSSTQTLASPLLSGGTSYNFTAFLLSPPYNTDMEIIASNSSARIFLTSSKGIKASVRIHFYNVTNSSSTLFYSTPFTGSVTLPKTIPLALSIPLSFNATLPVNSSLAAVVEVKVNVADNITFYYDSSTRNSTISLFMVTRVGVLSVDLVSPSIDQTLSPGAIFSQVCQASCTNGVCATPSVYAQYQNLSEGIWRNISSSGGLMLANGDTNPHPIGTLVNSSANTTFTINASLVGNYSIRCHATSTRQAMVSPETVNVTITPAAVLNATLSTDRTEYEACGTVFYSVQTLDVNGNNIDTPLSMSIIDSQSVTQSAFSAATTGGFYYSSYLLPQGSAIGTWIINAFAQNVLGFANFIVGLGSSSAVWKIDMSFFPDSITYVGPTTIAMNFTPYSQLGNRMTDLLPANITIKIDSTNVTGSVTENAGVYQYSYSTTAGNHVASATVDGVTSSRSFVVQ